MREKKRRNEMKSEKLVITTVGGATAKYYSKLLRDVGVKARASGCNVLLPLGCKLWQAELYKKMIKTYA
jgi:hypothetical protein